MERKIGVCSRCVGQNKKTCSCEVMHATMLTCYICSGHTNMLGVNMALKEWTVTLPVVSPTSNTITASVPQQLQQGPFKTAALRWQSTLASVIKMAAVCPLYFASFKTNFCLEVI